VSSVVSCIPAPPVAEDEEILELEDSALEEVPSFEAAAEKETEKEKEPPPPPPPPSAVVTSVVAPVAIVKKPAGEPSLQELAEFRAATRPAALVTLQTLAIFLASLTLLGFRFVAVVAKVSFGWLWRHGGERVGVAWSSAKGRTRSARA
jgi:hypothetical protein